MGPGRRVRVEPRGEAIYRARVTHRHSEAVARLRFARGIAADTGRLLMSWLGRIESVDRKRAPVDLVTAADRAAEALLGDAIARAWPDDGFIGEETGASAGGGDWTWVVDPLDGTTNFVHRLPRFCVSIGILHCEHPAVGVIHQPSASTTWHAVQGEGAWCGGRRLAVSATDELGSSLLATGFPYDRAARAADLLGPVQRCFERARGLRRFGSAALDLVDVAEGRFDGFWEDGLSPWDLAAGVLLVREAGGTVTGYGGAPFVLSRGEVIASNGPIHGALVALVDGP